MAKTDYSTLDKDTLVRLLQTRDRHTKLGLVWEAEAFGTEKAINDDCVFLKPMPGLGSGEGPYRNLLIEGDNFDALRYLNLGYRGAVKCIYIDPPYNTGKKDFVYNDVFVDRDDAYRHSKWLEFMSKRLSLARDLLREDGVIFVSIADHEVFHLGLLMNQVFGESNKVGVIVWKNVTDNNPTQIAQEHEYILCYVKNQAVADSVWKSSDLAVKEKLLAIEAEMLAQHSDVEKRQKAYSAWIKDNRPYMAPLDNYKYIDDGGIYAGSRSVHNPGKEGYRYDVIHPRTGKPCKEPLMGYRFPEDTMKDLLEKKKILFGSDHSKLIELKTYLSDYKQKLSSVIELDGRAGPNELKELFPDDPKIFNNPKPSALIEELLSFVTRDDDLILDFFAGSGTTGHAAMKLNRNDGGKRRCILVSSTEATAKDPGKNLCRDVTAQRLKRAAKREDVLYPFSYLRTLRIPREKVSLALEDEQIWIALQQMHTGDFMPADGTNTLLVREQGGVHADLAFATKIDSSSVAKLKRLAGRSSKGLVVYSRQPGLLKQRLSLENVSIEKLPDALLSRFGVSR